MLPANTDRVIDCSQNNYNEFLLKFGTQNGTQSYGGSYVYFIIDNNVSYMPIYGYNTSSEIVYRGFLYLSPEKSSRKIYTYSDIATSIYLYARNSHPYTIMA